MRNTKPKPKPTAATLYICDQIVRNYNTTAAFVFAHVSYHIIKHGSYDASPRAAQSVTGVSRMSVKRWLQVFVSDKLFIEQEGRHDFRSSLVFNTNVEGDNRFSLANVIDAYRAVFTNAKKESSNPVLITGIELSSLDTADMLNKKAEYQRALHYLKSHLRDRIASANVNSNSTRNKVNARYYTELAKNFGVAVNTIRKLIKTLVKQSLLSAEYIGGNLILSARNILGTAAISKAKRFAKSSNQAKQPKESPNQAPGDPYDIPFLRYS